MIEIAVTDTHALLWYARSEWNKLGVAARGVYAAADQGRAAIGVPTTTLVELADAARKGNLHFPMGFEEWTRALFSSGRFFPLDLTLEIVVQAQALYAIPERTDRLIAATAAHLGYPLLTRDPEIGRAAGVEVVW
jgi:PIN domain nuclease of toxin-antitoxin system